jgi:D-alanyl-D-alanine carboxypeptidase (penicillin-binding protein 5/6)
MNIFRKISPLVILCLAFSFCLTTLVKDAGARSNRKRVSNLSSKHKFQPDGLKGTLPASRITDLSKDQQTKKRPTQARKKINASQLQKRISSKSAIVMDSASGEVLFALRPERAAQPASTIKILTGLIAIQSLENKDWIPASRRAAGMPRSKIYIKRGKSYRANDMINAVLLSSANDASVALAEKIAGSERVFAKLMTHKARAWGAENTVCKTATGLTAKGQKSTVLDLAVLFNRAMDNEEFASRIGRTRIKTGYGKLLKNHNRALWQIDGAEGGKTGYTRAARQTYVGKFKRGENELTVAFMGSETMWDDIKNLVEYGFSKKKSMGLVTAAR